MSSLLQSGVVLVPQLAQLNAPTATRAFFALIALALASLSLAAGEAISSGALGEAMPPIASASAAGTSAADRPAARTLLYVGHPEQASVPPVPSQRPSPGQVPNLW